MPAVENLCSEEYPGRIDWPSLAALFCFIFKPSIKPQDVSVLRATMNGAAARLSHSS